MKNNLEEKNAVSTIAAENCVFCKIIAGKIPSHKVYENDDYIAFLSIDPRSAGHTLIVPKKHYRWVWDVPSTEIGEYFKVSQKIALALKKAFGQDLVCSHVEGEEVPHAHIWIYPDPRNTGGDKKDFAGNAAKIIAAI